jgi:hypothetical protein
MWQKFPIQTNLYFPLVPLTFFTSGICNDSSPKHPPHPPGPLIPPRHVNLNKKRIECAFSTFSSEVQLLYLYDVLTYTVRLRKSYRVRRRCKINCRTPHWGKHSQELSFPSASSSRVSSSCRNTMRCIPIFLALLYIERGCSFQNVVPPKSRVHDMPSMNHHQQPLVPFAEPRSPIFDKRNNR